MKQCIYYILIIYSIIFWGCDQAQFVLTPEETPIQWRKDDALYQSLLYGESSIKKFNNTDSTIVIDAMGEKAFLKLEHDKGCIVHKYEILIPSLAINKNNYQMPWIINHQHEYAKCEVNVITRYTLDLKSIPIDNDWVTNPPQVLNVSEQDKPLIKVLIKQ